MMVIPLIPDCRFREDPSGLSVLVCLFCNNDGGASHAVCLQRGVSYRRAVGPPVVQFVLQTGREILLERCTGILWFEGAFLERRLGVEG